MIQVEPRLNPDWPERVVLHFDVPYSLAAFRTLQDVVERGVDEMPVDIEPETSPLVPVPDGFLIGITHGSPASLAWDIERLAERGLSEGRVSIARDVPSEVVEWRRKGSHRHPWVVAWLVPALPPARPRREAPARWRSLMLDHLVGDTESHIICSFPYPHRVGLHEFPTMLERWQETRTSVPVINLVDSTNHPVVVLRQDLPAGDLIGIGVGGSAYLEAASLVDAIDAAGGILAEAANEIDYGVVGVHLPSLYAEGGAPFEERRPVADTAQMLPWVIRWADRVTIDVGPVQFLGPGHHLARGSVADVKDLGGGRRLVRVGDPVDWATQTLAIGVPRAPDVQHQSESTAPVPPIVEAGRRLLGGSLPSRHELSLLSRSMSQ